MLKPNLFLLHYAGGNVYSFNFITPFLKERFNIIPLELPGRGKRIRENLIYHKDLAVNDLLDQMLGKMDSNPFVIYGHSMGANLGFLITNELEKRKIFPLYLIVSGNPGPNIGNEKQRFDLPQKEFISELKILGGIEKEIIDDEEFFSFFEPVLRADFEIVEKEHRIGDDVKISTPIYAIMGDKEKHFTKIQNWKKYTSNSFECKLFEGNHFFIYDFAEEIANTIIHCSEVRNIS